MSTVVPFVRPVTAQRADGVFAAVNIAARRLGFSDEMALRAARNARQRFLSGGQSAAKVASDAKATLRVSADKVLA